MPSGSASKFLLNPRARRSLFLTTAGERPKEIGLNERAPGPRSTLADERLIWRHRKPFRCILHVEFADNGPAPLFSPKPRGTNRRMTAIQVRSISP